MNEFQVDDISAPGRIEDTYAKDRRTIYGWNDDLTKIKLVTPDHNMFIYLYIIRNYFSPPEQYTNYDRCKDYDPDSIPKIFADCNITEINNLIWTSYKTPLDLPDLNRPIPRNGNFHFEAIPENYSKLSDAEMVRIDFENVPEQMVNQIIKSLNISGLGSKAIERFESWEDYISRARKPNDYNGYAQGISALEFIDILYDKSIHYDSQTGELFYMTKKKKVGWNETQQLAIDAHYWGQIPLPKNVTADSPNGQ